MRIYLTNLGKYNEGYLVGKWIELPMDQEDLDEAKKEIGINEQYEEWFITDWDESPIEIDEYDDIDTLNEIAEAFEEMDETEKEVYEFMVRYEGMEWQQAIEKIKNQDYLCYQEVKDEWDLGHAIAENWEIPQNLEFYIAYEKIGRDSQYNEGWTLYHDMAILVL